MTAPRKTFAVDGFWGKNHSVAVAVDEVYRRVHVRVHGPRGAEVTHLEFSPERARLFATALNQMADAIDKEA